MVWFRAQEPGSVWIVTGRISATSTPAQRIELVVRHTYQNAAVLEYPTPSAKAPPAQEDSLTSSARTPQIVLATRSHRPSVAPLLDTADAAARFNIRSSAQLRDMHLAVGGMSTPRFLSAVDYSKGSMNALRSVLRREELQNSFLFHACFIQLDINYSIGSRQTGACEKKKPVARLCIVLFADSQWSNSNCIKQE
jgi:hypothetical protein